MVTERVFAGLVPPSSPAAGIDHWLVDRPLVPWPWARPLDGAGRVADRVFAGLVHTVVTGGRNRPLARWAGGGHRPLAVRVLVLVTAGGVPAVVAVVPGHAAQLSPVLFAASGDDH